MFKIITLALLSSLAISLPASEETPKSEKVTIELQRFADKSPNYYNIYRHTEPITATNLIEAELLAARIPNDQKAFSYLPTHTGKAYYLVTTATAFGEEKVIFSDEYRIGPLSEKDKTPPSPVKFRAQYVNIDKSTCVRLKWKLPMNLRNPEKIAKYHIYRSSSTDFQDSDLLATEKIAILNVVDREQSYTDTSGMQIGKKYYYQVLPVDGSGNRPKIRPEQTITTMLATDLATNSTKHFLTENLDIATTRMYPLLGKETLYKVKIYNRGSMDAEKVPVLISVPNDEQVLFNGEISIAMNSSKIISFSWTPKKVGKHKLIVDINSDKKTSEIDYSNNKMLINLHVLTKPKYIIWYGNPMTPKYSNVAQVNNSVRKGMLSRIDWNRIGAMPCDWAGLGFGGMKVKINKEPTFNDNTSKGALVDEINPKHDFTDLKGKDIQKSLLSLHKNNLEIGCDPLIAYWSVGSTIHESMKVLLDNGAIDLIMFEKYFKCPKNYDRKSDPRKLASWRHNLKITFDKARAGGYIDKIVIGISVVSSNGRSKKQLDNYLTFIEEQMYFITTQAPEISGIAIWNASNDYLSPKVDALCYKYFIEKEESKDAK